MPLYEYQCESCGTRVEKIQKFTDPPPDACEACGGAVRKLPSSPAIQFKGSGFYITDYARKTAVEGATSTDGTHSGEGTKSADGTKAGEGKPAETKSSGGDGAAKTNAGGTSSGSTPTPKT